MCFTKKSSVLPELFMAFLTLTYLPYRRHESPLQRWWWYILLQWNYYRFRCDQVGRFGEDYPVLFSLLIIFHHVSFRLYHCITLSVLLQQYFLLANCAVFIFTERCVRAFVSIFRRTEWNVFKWVNWTLSDCNSMELTECLFRWTNCRNSTPLWSWKK